MQQIQICIVDCEYIIAEVSVGHIYASWCSQRLSQVLAVSTISRLYSSLTLVTLTHLCSLY